jgi:5-methylcytosine-specific restriction endonuclease McrA
MNTYSTSDGKRFTQSQIDRKIHQAKAEALRLQYEDHGYNFCEECGNNGTGTRLDCSHDISVKKAKENGQSEHAWNPVNITILCRTCHQEKDKLNLKFTG